MSNEELLKRIDELEAAGVLTKEEADAKRQPILDKIAKEKADAEEAERLAREEEEKAQAERQAKADEFWNKVGEQEGESFVDKAFKLLVPAEGKCDTLAGELIRAINRIMYRDWNDGDVFYEGYGLETAGAPAAFIADKISAANEKLEQIAEDGLEDRYYTNALEEVAGIIEDFIRDNPESLTEPFDEDMWDWDGDGWREIAPTYETDLELPRELQDHIDAGNISERDLIDEVEYWEWNDKTGDESFSIDWGNMLYIEGLSREGKDDWERNGRDWLEQYAEQLNDDFGDPNFDIRDELEVGHIIECFPVETDPDTENMAGQAIYKYIAEGELWDDLDGNPKDGAISYANDFVAGVAGDFRRNGIHYYDEDFEVAGITEEQVKAILRVLGFDDSDYHLGGNDDEDDTNEELKGKGHLGHTLKESKKLVESNIISDIDKFHERFPNSFFNEVENRVECADEKEAMEVAKVLGVGNDKISGNEVDGWIIELDAPKGHGDVLKDEDMYYEVEVGVLLKPEDKEYDSYKMDGVYGGQHSFYDESQYAFKAGELEKEKEAVLNYIKNGNPGIYGIIKGPFPMDGAATIDDIEEFDYDINSVMFSAFKQEDGNIVYNFLEGEEPENPEPPVTEEVHHKDAPLKKRRFEIDGLPSFEGYDYGAFWNGWSCPGFDKETAQEIADIINELMPEEFEIIYEEDKDRFVEIDHNYDGDVTEEEPDANKQFYEGADHMTEDGEKHLYPIGAWEWTWYEASEPEEDEEPISKLDLENPSDDEDSEYIVTDWNI